MTIIKPLTLALLAPLIAIILSGCNTLSPIDNLKQQVRQQKAFARIIPASHFPLQSVEQFRYHSDTLRVYIEGDGSAWQRKRPSVDPSPRNLVLLNLMFIDPFPDKLYLARPCHFIKGARCASTWWTDKRYSHMVVETMNSALETAKSEGGWKSFELVGYSGGATLALLLAAIRQDVVSVRTVAGNLAPRFADQLHGLFPSPHALSPLIYRRKLQQIPQQHFVGAKDSIVPESIANYYKVQLGKPNCNDYKVIPDIGHTRGWQTVWLQLLTRPFLCQKLGYD